MHEFEALIETPDGTLDTFVCHPGEDGPHPAIIFYMDAPAIREELRDMARRIATTGYYVMLPNLYYREGTEHTYGFSFAERFGPNAEAHAKRMFELMGSLSNAKIISDTKPLLDFIRADDNAKDGPVGCTGYCMSGQFVVAAAAAYPDDFAAAASFYGVGIITDKDDSPHLQADRIKAELYLAFAETDQYVSPEVVDQIPEVFEKAGVKCRTETYPGTEHGFAFPLRPAYDKPAGERHWQRMLSLFERNLKG